jgi:hypothetical protein
MWRLGRLRGRRRPPWLAAAAGMWLACGTAAQAQGRRVVEFFAGTAYNFPTPLTIRQEGEPDVRLSARYRTKPWQDSPYYAYRFGYTDRDGRAWEAELVHHKLYLEENLPPEVQRFEVTHGYNLVTVNRAMVHESGTMLRIGVGAVIGHPEATVRGKPTTGRGGFFDRGYFLSGPTLQLALGRRFPDPHGFFVSAEGKLTASWARLPIRDGTAVTPNVALHGLLGVGYAY